MKGASIMSTQHPIPPKGGQPISWPTFLAVAFDVDATVIDRAVYVETFSPDLAVRLRDGQLSLEHAASVTTRRLVSLAQESSR
jgi:hypothetical protein